MTVTTIEQKYAAKLGELHHYVIQLLQHLEEAQHHNLTLVASNQALAERVRQAEAELAEKAAANAAGEAAQGSGADRAAET